VHFVGIGGIGMSGIAELLANLGYVVTGSDLQRSAVTERLAALGVAVSEGHRAENVEGADVVVVSSAVRPSNPEVIEAARRQIPVIPRGEMLAELMRLRYAVAVAGAHGKTTTTSMIAVMLEQAGLDPTAVIGGRLRAFGSNARLGRGDVMVAEADESDRSFLKLYPTMAVLTNIDVEHLENYSGFEDLQQAFVEFANRVPFYGSVVACTDDAHVRRVLPRVSRRVVTYGLDAPADVTATDVSLRPFGATATVLRRQHGAADDRGPATVLGPLTLQVPGRHNLQNALGAVAVGLELALPFDAIARGLEAFRGVERRFDVRGEPNGILVVDDYGHHPTEIAAVLAVARGLGRRVVVAFQPHRHSRTAALMHAFGPALAAADHVVLTDIYAAGEEARPGVTVDALADAIRQVTRSPVDVVRRLDDVTPFLAGMLRPGDVAIVLGAGSIGTVADRLVARLSGAPNQAGKATA
jgi:UDP-N-acetylmuramate--alanine ligase